jgi:transposase-like protein
MSARKRLTPEERDRIIELKLNRVPVRTIAEQVGCQPKTVQATWTRWLAETAAERAESLEAVREEMIQRQQRVSTDARVGAIRARNADDFSAEARFLAEDRQALREIARLQGLDGAQRVELTGADGGAIRVEADVEGDLTVEEVDPVAKVGAFLDALADVGLIPLAAEEDPGDPDASE